MAAGHIGTHLAGHRLPAIRGARRWVVTLAATIASTYALDAVATAAGLALAASLLLHDLGHAWVLLFLAGSYVAWGAGMWTNLKANWELLERTGTSTNALSKLAYDLFKRATKSRRWRRVATDAGYAGTELAKETPYYAGAVGAALFSESITANDVIIFLGGANLGAAVYEFALAHGVRFFLRRAASAGYASFETEWRPQAYLAEYYATVEPDERRTIAFFVDAYGKAAPGQKVLIYGVGPTLHHVFLAAGTASEVHLAEYLPANLLEIERWLARDPEAHDWRPFVRYILECEGIAAPSDAQIERREELARAKITKLLSADLRRPYPLGPGAADPYGIVISAYCADSATGNLTQWHIFMQRIGALVRPSGTILTAALRRSCGYRVGGKLFPSANIDEGNLREALGLYCDSGDLKVEVAQLGAPNAKGYDSILLAQGRRREASRLLAPRVVMAA
jgi:hypothetical protein